MGDPTRRPKSEIDLQQLRQFLESMKTITEDFIVGPKGGEPLYHYTDLNGARSIISDNDLWLTNSRYSNDEEEITHGYRVAKKVIEEAKLGANPHPEWLPYLSEVAKLVEKPADEGVYICCFCKFDNLLSQWRGYAASGNGVSIQFHPPGFGYIAGPDSPVGGLMRLWRVLYEEKDQRDILSKALRFPFDNGLADPIETRAQRAADAITFFIPTFKNRDFMGEEEWRLIFTPPPAWSVKPRFRVARNMLVPYYTLKDLGASLDPPPPPDQPLPITGLLIGPSAQKTLNAASAQTLINARGYNFIVRVSDTPWRG
ncbi:MAG TPA: DUF2971 domain-containing protein [Thermoanaerobaculia bacterium]|jgi:hypothetical protein